MHPLSRLLNTLSSGALLALCWSTLQEPAAADLVVRPTPFSLEVPTTNLLASRPLPSLPLWIESISLQTPVRDAANPSRATTVRIRLRKLSSLIQSVEFRVSLQAGLGGQANLAAWTESGVPQFRSEAFGSPASAVTEVIRVPALGVDYVDLTLPGRGDRLTGLFMTALKNGTILHPIDFPPDPIADAFASNSGTAEDSSRDYLLLGRVAAMLDAGPFTVEEGTPTAIDFELSKKPSMALLTYEIRNVLANEPPITALNETPLPVGSIHFPDLADPAWILRREVGLPESTLQYSGWIKVQQLLPASSLVKGVNRISLEQPRFGGPVEIRNLELQIRNIK